MNANNEELKKLTTLRKLFESCDFASVLVLSFELIHKMVEENNPDLLIEVYQILSKVYFKKSDYNKAYQYAMKSSELIREFHSVEQALENTISISRLLQRQAAYGEGIALLKVGLRMANKYEKSRYEAIIFNYLGDIYYEIKQYEDSLKANKTALDIANKNNYSPQIIDIQLSLAKTHIALGECATSESYVGQAFEELDPSVHLDQLMEAYLIKANIFYQKGKYDSVIIFANQAKILSKKLEFDYDLARSYKWMHRAYSKIDQFQDAYTYLMKEMEINNKIHLKEREENLARMRIKYETDQKIKELKTIHKNYDLAIKGKKELQYIIDVMGRQNEELLETAVNDHLTGVYNRKYFMLKLEEEFSIAEEYNKDISCLIFDIDKFKKINDTYGHMAGDTILKHIAGICKEVKDEGDIIGRFGGDEFVMILVGKNLEDAATLGNNILSILRNTSVILDDAEVFTTISIGITDNKNGFPKNGEDMIRIADKALYKAKAAGRDRLCISCEE